MMQDDDKAWIEWRENFHALYDNANYSSSLQARVMHASHRLLERPFTKKDNFSQVLEIGAGTGEHTKFIKHNFANYVVSDMDEKTLEIAKQKIEESDRHKFSFSVQKGQALQYADESFDRVIAAHVLEHINQPHLAIKEWCRVVKNGGTLSILLPTDPGIAWRIGRMLGPRKHAHAAGIAYDYVMAREHVNSCVNLMSLLRHYFPERKEAWWPLRIPSVDVNLFYSFHAQVKK
ncbi:class I SAM-dependent methyltransferase [Kosakonia sacchari]|uniref:Class I SAM-dependent methyltransferase n=1 Tax=Kosakonia sacchari TaxID=1158459 RepID=A0ABZ0MW83_9ENTR|nr:class I SAM-dependent methyltransferase [Kosakonia sacchari]WOZ79005.1 class I SAM-dependent methyltransferase [Kosakonia sacchari]